MTPIELVTECLQKLGPCVAEEIDHELHTRRTIGLLDLSEWPRGVRAIEFLRQLERDGRATLQSPMWTYVGIQLPKDAAKQMSLFTEEALDRFTAEGKKAWADVPDAAEWVREQRGGSPSEAATDGQEK
jgi:hypothetical protein